TRFDLRAHLFEVVDLTVVSDDVATRCREHGLMPLWRKIEDRKTAVAECNVCTCITPDSRIVRSAMTQGVGHPPDQRFVAGSARTDDSRYAAHGSRCASGSDSRIVSSASWRRRAGFDTQRLH